MNEKWKVYTWKSNKQVDCCSSIEIPTNVRCFNRWINVKLKKNNTNTSKIETSSSTAKIKDICVN